MKSCIKTRKSLIESKGARPLPSLMRRGRMFWKIRGDYVELKHRIHEEEVVGHLAPIPAARPIPIRENSGFRDIASDIQTYNELTKQQSIPEILQMGNSFLRRQFGAIFLDELYLEKQPQKEILLKAKGHCRCGNTLVLPLHLLVDGSITDCGCQTPFPKEYEPMISVRPSEAPTRWTTTVDGIQWLGARYQWLVTLFVRNMCVVRKFTADTKEALIIRRDAERKYYGKSVVDQYYDLMYLELEQLRRSYIAEHPPKISGVSWDKTEGVWKARFTRQGRFIINKSFKSRKDAVAERLRIEKKYYGETLIPECYHSML